MSVGKDDTDKMFEDFFGYAAPADAPKKPRKTRQAKPTTPPKVKALEPEPVVAPEPVRSPGPSPHPPEGWDPPHHLDCGHMNHQRIRIEYAADVPYKERWPTTREVVATSPDDCQHCVAGVPGDPQFQTGEYRKPVPESRRRTPESERSGRYAYCTDPETGMYIGGIANYCLYMNPKGPWCAVHDSARGSVKPKGG